MEEDSGDGEWGGGDSAGFLFRNSFVAILMGKLNIFNKGLYGVVCPRRFSRISYRF